MANLENADVNDEELVTVFSGVKALINSRLLTYQSAVVKDNIPLVPTTPYMDKWEGSLPRK